MKTIILFLFSFSIIFAQTNSVELREGGGTLISSHSSVQEAYNAIPATVTGPMLIEITAAYTGSSETFPISFTFRNGTSSTNTITIRPSAGNTNALIQGTPSNAPLVILDDIDYLILDGRAGGTGTGLDLKLVHLATTGTNSSTVRFVNGATNNIIRYVRLENNTQNTAGPRTIEIQTSATNPTGNSNNLIEYNEIVGGRSGIGLTGTAANPNNNNTISNNKIFNFSFAGIWLLGQCNNIIITGNEIYQSSGYNTASSGINVGTVGNFTVAYNKIYNLQNTATTTLRGITVSGAAGSDGAVFNVYNNFISLPLDNGTKTSVYAIQFAGVGAYTANIYYNTIRLAGTHTGGTAGTILSAGIVKSNTGAGSTYNQVNNIVLNTRTGGPSNLHTGSFVGSTAIVGTMNVDYNVYYGADATSLHAGWNDFAYSDLAQYKTAASPHEQNTIFKPTEFVSLTDLHLTGTSNGDVDLVGLPIVGITDDIDGQTRNVTHPYRGADEGTNPIPVELTSFAANTNGNNVILNWSTATETNTMSFIIERKLNETWQNIGQTSAAGNSVTPISYQFTDENVAAGNYQYRLKIVDFDGSFEYSNVIEIDVTVPLVFSLEQNYPNPFNPSTTINYQLAETGKVSLKIFDVIGKEVTTIVNEIQEAGVYSVKFDTKSLNLNSGVYFYRLETGEFVSTKKMILIK